MTTRARPAVLKTLGFQNVLIQEEQHRCVWNVLILRGGIQKNTTFASRMSPVILYQLQSIELGVPCPQIGHCVQLRCSHDAVVVKTMMMMMSKKESLKSIHNVHMPSLEVWVLGFGLISFQIAPKIKSLHFMILKTFRSGREASRSIATQLKKLSDLGLDSPILVSNWCIKTEPGAALAILGMQRMQIYQLWDLLIRIKASLRVLAQDRWGPLSWAGGM